MVSYGMDKMLAFLKSQTDLSLLGCIVARIPLTVSSTVVWYQYINTDSN